MGMTVDFLTVDWKPKQGKCHARVSDHTGYHFVQCSHKAKYTVIDQEGGRAEVCGIHRRVFIERGCSEPDDEREES